MGTLATDSFNRANANPLDGNWTKGSAGALAQMKLAGNAVTSATPNQDSVVLENTVTWPANQYSFVIIGTLGNKDGGPACRIQADGSCYFCSSYDGTNILLFSWNITGAGLLQISGGVGQYTAGAKIAIKAIGTTISVEMNDVVVCSVTDTAFATGKAGMHEYDGVMTYDSWEGGDFSVPALPSYPLRRSGPGVSPQERFQFQRQPRSSDILGVAGVATGSIPSVLAFAPSAVAVGNLPSFGFIPRPGPGLRGPFNLNQFELPPRSSDPVPASPGNASGSIGTVTASTPTGLATGAAAASGGIGTDTASTPTGAATGAAAATGSIGTATASTPTGFATGAAGATAAIGTATASAPSATATGAANASGGVGTATATAPTGIASSSAAGSIGTATASAPSASATGGANTTATLATATASTPTGLGVGAAATTGSVPTASTTAPDAVAIGAASATGGPGTVIAVAPSASASGGGGGGTPGNASGSAPVVTVIAPAATATGAANAFGSIPYAVAYPPLTQATVRQGLALLVIEYSIGCDIAVVAADRTIITIQ